MALLTFAIAPHWLLHWLLPSGPGGALRWSWWQQAVGDSYTLIALAALALVIITNQRTHPHPPEPRPGGTPAASRDQELASVPSPTGDRVSDELAVTSIGGAAT